MINENNLKKAEKLVSILSERRLKVTFAESCTGGRIANTFTAMAGASEYFKCGVVAYANEAKQSLVGVKAETLEAYGAVSEQTAREMAEGGAKAANADAALAVTGIAGPDGGTAEKPVGLVYIGCHVNGNTVVERNVFSGNRREVREQSVGAALALLKRQLQ